MSSKSANYCFANRDQPVGVLMLSEVALGKQYTRTSAEYEAARSCRKAKADSTWGLGKTAPDPKGAKTLPADPEVTVPMGKGGPNAALQGKQSSLLYNEFIVYNTAQIRNRFILQVKFDFV